ncbi:hypothetical protein Bca52824_077312 [Brassica carinata]|uniref:X8 domain-containing protein n=1 Tax=Brassica carinata TaxID=52824 RepID=A0A8X7PWX4_BRACI|nr:hypothetical protein Bca52824_077312 [Brassica carinata]
MNAYFQRNGRTDGSCNFSGTGVIVGNNPSNDACRFLTNTLVVKHEQNAFIKWLKSHWQ